VGRHSAGSPRLALSAQRGGRRVAAGCAPEPRALRENGGIIPQLPHHGLPPPAGRLKSFPTFPTIAKLHVEDKLY